MQTLIDTINQLITLAEVARSEGILPLEQLIHTLAPDQFFLKTGLTLVIEGNMPTHIDEVLTNLIESSGYDEIETKEKTILKRGILAIQKGENPYILNYILGALCGEAGLKMLLEQTNHIPDVTDFATNPNQYITPIPERTHFQTRLLGMPARDIHTIVKGIDNVQLAVALKGCDLYFIMNIQSGFSKMQFNQVCQMLKLIKPDPATSLEAQQAILDHLDAMLTTEGEVIATLLITK